MKRKLRLASDVKKFTQEEVDEINQEELSHLPEWIDVIRRLGLEPRTITGIGVNGEEIPVTTYVHPSFTPSQALDPCRNEPQYNVYIPSKGRADRIDMLTCRMFEEYGFHNWYFAVEPMDALEYASGLARWGLGPEKLIIRPLEYRTRRMFDPLDSFIVPDKLAGSATAYNFLQDFSRSMGESHYWTADDDIRSMSAKAYRGNGRPKPGTKYDSRDYFRDSYMMPEHGFYIQDLLRSTEDLESRFRNVGVIGFEKFGMKFNIPAGATPNTRVYSFYLTDNSKQVRHVGRFNNDVIYSMNHERRGRVNVVVEGICYNSLPTQMLAGGLTGQYRYFGTLDKGKCLVKAWPMNSIITYRYSRIHHRVNYFDFATQMLKGKPVTADLPPAPQASRSDKVLEFTDELRRKYHEADDGAIRIDEDDIELDDGNGYDDAADELE